MSTEADRTSPFVRPRPGVVKALGILNIVIAAVVIVGALMEALWIYVAVFGKVADPASGAEPASSPGIVFLGMNDLKFIRFCAVDAATAIALNLAMLASGIGLVNLKGWGARLWAWASWIKILRLFALGGVYILVVSPSFSETMARAGVEMIKAQAGPRRAPPVGELIRVYSIMNLILAVGMIVLGSIYPAASLWLLGRPGVKAALADDPPKEPEPS